MTWVPEACTLPTADQPARIAAFDELFAAAERPPERLAATRLRVVLGGALLAATAGELAAREAECCSFFSFTLRVAAGASVLEVEVPPAHVAVLDAVQERAEAGRAGVLDGRR